MLTGQHHQHNTGYGMVCVSYFQTTSLKGNTAIFNPGSLHFFAKFNYHHTAFLFKQVLIWQTEKLWLTMTTIINWINFMKTFNKLKAACSSSHWHSLSSIRAVKLYSFETCLILFLRVSSDLSEKQSLVLLQWRCCIYNKWKPLYLR